jgi:UDP-N-acetylglucosamine enolpyruvyl transferase
LPDKKETKAMDKFVITGGAALNGEIATNGSKNSALPALAAALLTDEPVVLGRIPRVRDISRCSGCWWTSARPWTWTATPSG